MPGRPRNQPDGRRLPAGLVSVTDDSAALAAAVADLHAYATTDRRPGRPRRGVVFRFVEPWEQQAIRHQLYAFFGDAAAPAREADYAVSVGHPHVLDDSGVTHAWNRHGNDTSPDVNLWLTVPDLQQVPLVVDPRNIVEFSIVNGTPRIVYERGVNGLVLVVVEEIRRHHGLAIKTMLGVTHQRRFQGFLRPAKALLRAETAQLRNS